MVTGLRLFNAGGSNQKLDHGRCSGYRGQWLSGTADTFYTESRKERRLILRGAPLRNTERLFVRGSLLIVSARLIRRRAS